MAYTTKAKVSEYGIAIADIADAWLTDADNYINSHIGKFGNTAEETIFIDSLDGNHIDINQRKIYGRIQSIASLKIDGEAQDLDELKIYNDEGYIRLTSWADDFHPYGITGAHVRSVSPDFDTERRGLLNIEIKGVFGWSTVPDDIVELASLLVVKKALTFVGGTAAGDIIQETIGKYSYKRMTTGETLTPARYLDEAIKEIESRYGQCEDAIGEAI